MARFYEVTKGQATGAASAFIGWIDQIRCGAEDHLDPVDPDHLERTGARRAFATPGLTTAPSARSARCRCLVGVVVVAMVVFVGVHAWPIFEHNGLSWLGPGREPRSQISKHAGNTSVNPPASAYHLRAWPLVYGTLLTTALAVALGARRSRCSPRSSSSSSRRRALRRVAIPVIRLLASVPSVIYGLIGMLVLVPFVGNHLITALREGVGAEHRAAHRRGAAA